MGYDPKKPGDNKTLDFLKDLLGNIGINQTVSVNGGSPHGHKDKKDKKNDDDKGKKCECKGSTNGLTLFAKICPDCTIEESFVAIPGNFNSLTVNKPECFEVGNTEYLTTSGKGVIPDSIVGAYTLILADNPVTGGLFALTFAAVTDAGIVFVVIFIDQQDVDIEDCRHEKCRKSHKQLPDNLAEIQNLANNSKPFAKKITLRPDGTLEEEDLSNLF